MSHGGISILSPVETSDRGTTGVQSFIQDQTTPVLDVPFLQQESTPTLAIDTVADGTNRNITLTAGHGLTDPADVGKTIEIADPNNGSFFMQCAITAIVGDVVTLDCPVNRVYLASNAIVAVSTADMNVNGSVTSQVFSVLPFTAQKGDMVRVIVEMRDDAAMAFDTFGGISELTNGVVVRVNNGDGTYRNLYNFKSNGDIIEQAFDHSFQTGVGGSTRGFTSRITWGGQSKRGVVIRLEGSKSESLEIVVQDDLTGLTRMHWTCSGHELQEG
jgi:hypothetical protein